MMNPRISILIPAYNEEKFISATIDSIHQSFSEIGTSSYEMIVCDNHSTDTTAALAQSKGAKVVFEAHRQIARARNTAARAAQGEWLIFLDADTLLHPKLLKATIENLKDKKICGGGTTILFDTKKIPLFAKIFVWTWNKVSIIFKLAAGAYLYCRRDIWLEVGGFNENFYVSEEINFSMKLKALARKKGMEFKVISHHPILTSSRKLAWYSSWQIIKQLNLLLIPGAMMKKRYCKLWYIRPSDA